MRKRFQVRKYKHPRLKFVLNYREDGKRKRKFFETKEEATAEAALKNAQLKKSGIEGAEFSSRLREMAQECAERLLECGKTLKDATDFFLAHVKASEKSCTALQLVKELVAAKKADGSSERHVSDLRSRLTIFANKFDGQPVAAITSREIDDWLRSLPVSPVTRNHYRRLIVLAFNYAVPRGYVTSNPAEKKKTATAKEPKKKIRFLGITEAARLLESASPEVLPYIAIGLFAGLRRAEILRLDWSEIDFEDDLIEVKPINKTGWRRVPIEPNLREWLLPVRKHSGKVTPPQDFRKQFDETREAAGLLADWPDNGLRHSYASYWLANFKNAAALAERMGTSIRIIRTCYDGRAKPKEAERYWSIRPQSEEKIVQLVAKAKA